MNGAVWRLVFAGCLAGAQIGLGDQIFRYHARVLGVVDGSTVVLSNRTFQGNVRLAGVAEVTLDGIRAPELGQPGGDDARAFLEQMLTNQDVSVTELVDQGVSQGAWLFLGQGERCANVLMIVEGKAWLLKPKAQTVISSGAIGQAHERMKDAYPKVKEQRIGIWASTNAIPPWEWADQHRLHK